MKYISLNLLSVACLISVLKLPNAHADKSGFPALTFGGSSIATLASSFNGMSLLLGSTSVLMVMEYCKNKANSDSIYETYNKSVICYLKVVKESPHFISTEIPESAVNTRKGVAFLSGEATRDPYSSLIHTKYAAEPSTKDTEAHSKSSIDGTDEAIAGISDAVSSIDVKKAMLALAKEDLLEAAAGRDMMYPFHYELLEIKAAELAKYNIPHSPQQVISLAFADVVQMLNQLN